MDVIGQQTLEIMQEAKFYNRWTLELILPWISGKVLEVGSGIGSFAGQLIQRNFQVTALDINKDYLTIIKRHFPQIETFEFDLQSSRVSRALQGSFDTIIAINVLEHLPNLSLALTNISQMLRPGGRAIILIPGFQFAYGTLDKNLGHYRRYTTKQLLQYLRKVNLDPISSRYINFWGLIGWYINGKVLKKTIIPKFQIKIFDVLFRPWMEIEKYVKFPLGLSVLCVASKK